MDANEFLSQMGWPQDRLGEAGQAKWVGVGADGLSTLSATLDRDGAGVKARVASSSMDSSEELLMVVARFENGAVVVERSQAGEPPEPMPIEDAAHAFDFLRRGLPKFVFVSMGPLDIARAKQKMG